MRCSGSALRTRWMTVGTTLLGVACHFTTDRPDVAESPADTAYLVAAFRTEAQARLDHLAIRLARLRVVMDGRAGWSDELDAVDGRRAELARRIREFEPTPGELPRAADQLEAALDTLRRDLDHLVGRMAVTPPTDPR